jgi:hypothetical protein
MNVLSQNSYMDELIEILKAHLPLLTYCILIKARMRILKYLMQIGNSDRKLKLISLKNDKTMARLNGFLLVL